MIIMFQLHHTDKFNGVPYGLFLGPMASFSLGLLLFVLIFLILLAFNNLTMFDLVIQELEEVGGNEELEKEIGRRIKLYKKGSGSGSSS